MSEYNEKNWYVVNTYSGHENKVKDNLEMRIESMGMESYIFRIVVPETKQIEVKDGKEIEKSKKMFPGYILIEMDMTDEAWFIVRNTPGVTGFIGSSGKGAKPIPLLPEEIERILDQMGVNIYEFTYEVGDKVAIASGAFAGQEGTILTLDIENDIVILNISLFGRDTEIETKLNEIKKID